MKKGFTVLNRKTAAALLIAVAAALCLVRESAAESLRVQRMRVEAVRELRPLKHTPVRLRVAASQMAARIAVMRVKAPSNAAREFRIIENELRQVAYSGNLSWMERKAANYHGRHDERQVKRPPQYSRHEKRPHYDGKNDRRHDDGRRRPQYDQRRGSERRRDERQRRDSR